MRIDISVYGRHSPKAVEGRDTSFTKAMQVQRWLSSRLSRGEGGVPPFDSEFFFLEYVRKVNM